MYKTLKSKNWIINVCKYIAQNITNSITYFDKNETSLSTLWINSSVEPVCLEIPLMKHFIGNVWGSGISFLCTKTEPSGQNVSILLAKNQSLSINICKTH